MNLSLSINLITLLLFIHFFNPSSARDGKYSACSQRIQLCGHLSAISYPFYDGETRPDYCGHPGFKLDCHQDPPMMSISSLNYFLLSIDETTATVARADTWSFPNCPSSLVNDTIDPSLFQITSSDHNITFLYDCDDVVSVLGVNCHIDEQLIMGYYMTSKMLEESHFDLWENCKGRLSIPILKSLEVTIDIGINEPVPVVLNRVFQQGFQLGMIAELGQCNECVESGGQCGYDTSSNKFVCYCTDGNYDAKCGVNSYRGHSKKMVFIAATTTPAAGLLIMGFLIFFSKVISQKCKSIPQDRSVEDCLQNYKSPFPRRYTYASVKKMTNSFKQKLGEGGFGAVFKGNLLDGHVVAVKVLKQSKGDGQEFVNELMSISRTSHVNIVPLLGFCFEGHKRALIYEFMPNGSLAKFVPRRDSIDNNQSLSTPKLLEIVVGIARGLEYLHRGCNTRIVHFDIKPHNILLDAEFTPKISDFGLAKAFKQKESIISMSGARGTAGYIAPEVILRSFGGVSHKSDVYSFGMMTLEMVGCTKRLNQNVENSSELYFPRWIYKQLEQETLLDSDGILSEDEKELERKMILVGLWCIQTDPMSRPSMSRVVEMLEGKTKLLEVPPMPSLASPPRQQQAGESSSSFHSTTT